MLDSFLIELRRSPVLIAATLAILSSATVALLAPILAPVDPNLQNLRATLAPPSATFLLGTDEYGRDLLSRMIFGTRNSLVVGAAVVLLSGLIGAVLGITAGYFGGWLDMVVMRAADVMMAFPYLVLALGLIAALGAGIPSTIVALTVAFAPIYVRIVRSKVLVVKEEAYIEAARLIGVVPRTIAVRHVLPNVAGPVLVQGALTFAFAVLAEASLSFVGLGVPPPAASFGNIIAAGRDHIIEAPWIATSSGIAIVTIVLSLLVLADGLRDAIDPYQHRL